ncbi:MAG: DUF493 domain-containing protein [Bacteriovoracaceae bacterium]|jgi:uncharacterized protein|nr:DUF493 domain-containing protein [Bacteriovoracaceae bacterium]
MGEKREKFKELLDRQYDWPAHYNFKCIVKSETSHLVNDILKEHRVTIRASKTGKYRSFTAHVLVNSSDEVLNLYEKVNGIDGVMGL